MAPDDAMSPSRDRWDHLWHRLGGRADDGDHAWTLLYDAYGAPARAYHTWVHLDETLRELDLAGSFATHPDEVEAALWFHDVVYEPLGADNEGRSADLARETLLRGGIPAVRAERVAALIGATRHQATPEAPDAALVADADLAILAAAPARFDAYESGIRQEYRDVPEEVFRRERGRILQALLDREWIYGTQPFRVRYEGGARANLVRSLARLGATSP